MMVIISKRLSKDQTDVLNIARQDAAHTQAQVMHEALELYCEKHGVAFPATKQHGGWRHGAGRPPKETPEDDNDARKE